MSVLRRWNCTSAGTESMETQPPYDLSIDLLVLWHYGRKKQTAIFTKNCRVVSIILAVLLWRHVTLRVWSYIGCFDWITPWSWNLRQYAKQQMLGSVFHLMLFFYKSQIFQKRFLARFFCTMILSCKALVEEESVLCVRCGCSLWVDLCVLLHVTSSDGCFLDMKCLQLVFFIHTWEF